MNLRLSYEFNRHPWTVAQPPLPAIDMGGEDADGYGSGPTRWPRSCNG
jgi:hypothetical protein